MDLHFKEFGDGVPVVLLHAFPLSGKMWQQNAAELAKSGFRVITPDLRGFGESAFESEIFTMEDMAGDVARLLDSLGIDKAIVCGLSMGGYIALNLYRLFPQRFLGLVLCDTNSTSDPPANREIRYQLADKLRNEGPRVLSEMMLPNLISDHTAKNNPLLVDYLKNEFHKCPADSAIAALMGMAERGDHSSVLQTIKVPTLLVFGEYDKITNIENARNMEAEIKGSELSIIKNAGHYSSLENPSSFNTSILNFLEGSDF